MSTERVTGGSGFRSGFGCLVGRPNTGKSTLLNALVGEKVAIASSRPQTTRHAIRGVVHRPAGQLVLVDTPGLHKPRTLLGERLNTVVRDTWSEVDVVAVCLAADQPVGPGDLFLLREMASLRAAKVAIATKSDTVSRDRLAEYLVEAVAAGRRAGIDFDEVVPVSAVDGENISTLTSVLIELLPAGEPLYPDGHLTDEPERVLIAELVREAALEGVHDELPHSIAVEITEMGPREGRPPERPLVDVYATVYVERPTQKAIVVGAKGARLKAVGSSARVSLEALLGSPVYLDLHVKVLKEWQHNPRHLRRLGF